jgi:predicted RNA binding protein YcfA (HicA-like mRNA interferase family)
LGWVFDPQHGSHIVLVKPGQQGHVTVPDHGSAEIIQKTFSSVLKQAALTRRELDAIAQEVL